MLSYFFIVFNHFYKPAYNPFKNHMTNNKSLADLIGVISHIGPHDFVSPTSKMKLHKIEIKDLE
jgi:hypothetical protein